MQNNLDTLAQQIKYIDISPENPKNALKRLANIKAPVGQIVQELRALQAAKPNSLNTPVENTNTALHIASEKGNINSIKAFLEVDKELINVKGEDRMTALHQSVKNNHLEAVKFLVENGATIDSQNNSKKTPLHLAALQGYVNIVNYLLIQNA